MAFSHRMSAAGLAIPGAKNAVAFGTSWTDDAGANAMTAPSANLPCKLDYDGHDQVGFILANTGTVNCQAYRVGGSPMATRSFGLAAALQWPFQGRTPRTLFALSSFNVAANSMDVGLDDLGCLEIRDNANGNKLSFGVPVPAGRTVITLASGASGTYAKVLGLPAVTLGVFANNATPTFILRYSEISNNHRFGGAISAEDYYTAYADVAGVSSVEAALAAEFNCTTPTMDALFLGDSIGACAYNSHPSRAYTARIASAYPRFFWRQMCVAGATYASALADRANVIDHATIAPITGTPHIVVAQFGTNELRAFAPAKTAAEIIADAVAMASALRTKWPDPARTRLLFPTPIPVGTSGATETKRRTVRDGLGAALAPYSATAFDPCAGSALFDTGNGGDAAVTACTAGNGYKTRGNTNAVEAGDRIHPGLEGMDEIGPTYVSNLAAAASSFDGAPAHRPMSPHMQQAIRRAAGRR